MANAKDTIEIRLDLIKQIQDAGKEVLRLSGHDVTFAEKSVTRGPYKRRKKKCVDAAECSSTY